MTLSIVRILEMTVCGSSTSWRIKPWPIFGVPETTIRALMRKGHVIEFADGPYGGYQAIRRDPVTGVYAGASESRKDGQAAGY